MKTGRLFSTIRGRIVILYTGLFALAFIYIYISINNLVTSFLLENRTKEQLKQAVGIASKAAALTYNEDAIGMYDLAVTSASSLSGRVLILNTDAIVIADSHSLLNGRVIQHKEVLDIVAGKDTSMGLHKITTDDSSSFFARKEWVVYYTAKISYQTRDVGILLVSMPIQDLVDMISSTTNSVLVILIPVTALVVIASILISKWISKPIEQMTSGIQLMSSGCFNVRVNVTGASEINQMAETFNMMSERLENIDRSRSEFVANASHEMKTPLSAIKILTETMLYQPDMPKEMYREFLADINQQIDRLNNLLTDLLALTSIDQTDMSLNFKYEQLKDIFAEVSDIVVPLAEAKEIKLVIEPLDINAYCEKTMLRTAIVNLTENAIKYTPQGGSVKLAAHTEDENLYITVTDTGIGIPKEDIPHIFERFYRVDKARSRGTGGTGLGLSIVKTIARLHRGDITVMSREGIGSVFTLKLPLRRQQR